MKIKEICEKTGLTDRTVRYYIEEKLISPFYTENYLGRKSFNFSEEDLERLKEIATLRAFGFSVEEIKDISLGSLKSQEIIEQVRQRTEESLDESQRRLRALSGLELSDEVGISPLAQKLSSADPIVEDDNTRREFGKIFRFWFRFCATLLAVWLPPLTSAVILLLRFASCGNKAIVRPMFLAFTLLCFLPSLLAILILNKLKGSLRVLRFVLMLVCVLCLPLSIFFSLNSVAMCEHNYRPYRTTVEATCYSEGEALLQCKYCAGFKTQVLEKREHTPAIKKGVLPTCAKEGLSDGSYCSVCQETLSEQTVVPKTQAHQAAVVKGVRATCTTDGQTDSTYCTVCKAILSASTVIPAPGHIYSQTPVPATCGLDGYILHECTCGDSYQTDPVRATNLHDFKFINRIVGYRCRECNLEVCEYGLADWSGGDGSDLVKYYITGPTKTGNTVFRALVVYGTGDLSVFSAENPPAWSASPYLRQVTTIIIESGISSIGANAFSSIPNDPTVSYKNVTCFVIRSQRFDIHFYPHASSGVSCRIIPNY